MTPLQNKALQTANDLLSGFDTQDAYNRVFEFLRQNNPTEDDKRIFLRDLGDIMGKSKRPVREAQVWISTMLQEEKP